MNGRDSLPLLLAMGNETTQQQQQQQIMVKKRPQITER